MITREQLKRRYEALNEHFTFKDFLGLSALIFGLLMSHSSFETKAPSATETKEVQQQLSKKKAASSKKATSIKKPK